MIEGTASVSVDNRFGFRQLSPLPSEEQLKSFYQDEYYRLLKQGSRAPELRRLTSGGPEAEQERNWLHQTLYQDVLDAIVGHAPKGKVLDAGAGPGELLHFLINHQIKSAGFDPSIDAVEMGRKQGLDLVCHTFESYLEQHRRQAAANFAAVVMLNVLEHVGDPVGVVSICHELLQPGGILVVRVPNDFTDIQEAAHAKIGGRPWWIAFPDHINYFNVQTLKNTYQGLGFDVVDALCDFPMEMFLLFGDNYIANRELGPACHKKRVSFEMSIPITLRQQLYRAFAQAGSGRNVLMVGRKKVE
jgi:2-polyprenyl-3-methyl-5-hydroxy-6-metoxy-1,4-benzoquinol methylase